MGNFYVSYMALVYTPSNSSGVFDLFRGYNFNSVGKGTDEVNK